MLKKIGFILVIVFMNTCSIFAKSHAFEEKERVVYEKDTIHSYSHTSSGLEVIWIENQNKNKSFTLGVKTPTQDSTGVNHIIEHTVFTGSKKYPNTALFFDANQRYPNTYMNAMTTADMTIYPFCTPYEECYKMLMNIYLDSILNPNMKLQPNSFFEESFHYNPETEQCGGVVYNEMKGAGANINRTIFKGIRQIVYEGTAYENDSGGDPSEIPKLTYEDFLSTYNTYYYPANMKVILHGDIDIASTLEIIDSYFNKYTKEDDETVISAVPKEQVGTKKISYPSEDSNGYVVKSFLIKEKLSTQEALELELWMDAYMLSSTSYFQKELQALGVRYVNFYKDNSLKYPIYSIVLPDIPKTKVDYYTSVLDKVTSYLIAKDFADLSKEKDILERSKIQMYDIDQMPTRGIHIAESILDSWAHDKEKYQYFIAKETIEQINMLDVSAKKRLLEDSEATNIQFIPEPMKPEEDPLTKSKFTKEEWGLIAQAMNQWQNQGVKGNLPLIDLEKLLLVPDKKCEVEKYHGINYITIPIETKLAETALYLNTNHIPKQQLPYLFLYEYLLNESAKEESPFKGFLTAKTHTLADGQAYKPYMKISIISTTQNLNHAGVLRNARTNLLAKNKRWYTNKINGFIYSFKEKMDSDVLSAMNMMNLGGMEGAKRYEYEKTFPLYEFVKVLTEEKNNDKVWINEIRKIDALLYTNKDVTVGINATKSKIKLYEKSWARYFKDYGTRCNKLQYQYQWDKMPQNSLYTKPSNVDYMVYSYQKTGEKIDGVDYIVASYLTKNYLQPHIRIQKGAYGSAMNTGFPYGLSIYTYRDPDYISSMKIISDMPNSLDKPLDEDDLKAAKADALSDFHRQFGFLESELMASEIASDLCYANVDSQYLITTQKQIIEALPDGLASKKQLLKDMIKNSCKSVCTDKRYESQAKFKIYK